MSGFELSLNQATTRGYPLDDTIRAAARAGIRHLGLWIEPLLELGLPRTKALLEEHGIGVSSLCRVGFVAGKEGAALQAALDDTRRAIDLAAELGHPMVAFIAGGLPDSNRSIPAAEDRVRAALESLVPYAQDAGVRLALEPLHPLFAAQRSIVTTIDQGLRIVSGLPEDAAGLLIDTYATWWDPNVLGSLAAAGPRIAGFQVSDFGLPLPVPENMNGRLFMGEGCIDFRTLVDAARGAGYTGAIEVEIFNDDVWSLPLETILDRVVTSFDAHVGVLEAA